MLQPTVLAGQMIVIAGPGGPMVETIARRLAGAGAGLILCGADSEALDELAWELAEKVDTPVEIAEWDGADPGAGLHAAVKDTYPGDAGLVLLDPVGWTNQSAGFWAPAVIVSQAEDMHGVGSLPGAATLMVGRESNPETVAAWVTFLCTPVGQKARPMTVLVD